MKQFIVLLGILPLLLVFLVQFSLEQTNSSRLDRLHNHVSAAKEVAKQDGYFTQENMERMKANIARDFKIDKDTILVDATITPRYRVNGFDERELIYYKVSVPIEQIMAGNRLFGISDEENRGYYTIVSYTASERLAP